MGRLGSRDDGPISKNLSLHEMARLKSSSAGLLVEPAVEKVDVNTQQSHGMEPAGQDLRGSLHGRTSSVSSRHAAVSTSEFAQLYAYADRSSLNLRQSRASSIISTRTKTSITTVQDELKDGIEISTSGGAIYRMGLDGQMLNPNYGRSRRSTELGSLPLDDTGALLRVRSISDHGLPNDIGPSYQPKDSTNRSFSFTSAPGRILTRPEIPFSNSALVSNYQLSQSSADPTPAKVPKLAPVGAEIFNRGSISLLGGDDQGVSPRDFPPSQPSSRPVMTEGGPALQVWLENADNADPFTFVGPLSSLGADRTGPDRDVAATNRSVTPTNAGGEDGALTSTGAENVVAALYRTIIRQLDAGHRSDLEAKDRELREARDIAAVLARQVVDLKSELLRTKGQTKAMPDPAQIRMRSQEERIESQSFSFPPLKLKHVQTLKGALKRRAEKIKKGMDDDLSWLIRRPTTSSTDNPEAEPPKGAPPCIVNMSWKNPTC